MNTPSPLVPQGSLQPQPRKKITFPMAALTIVMLHVLAIGVVLIQGCNKPAKKTDDTGLDSTTNTGLPPYNPPTNSYYSPAPSNTVPIAPSNSAYPASGLAAAPSNTSPPVESKPAEITPPASEETEYVVVKGDYLASIAKKHGVSLSALKKANPGVEPKKLKVGQKLKIPGGTTTTTAEGHNAEADSSGGGVYTVKAKDTLTKIAKAHGTSARKLRAFNNLSTDKLKVGQKLKIPAGGSEKTAAAKPAGDLDTTNSAPASTTGTNLFR